MYWAEKLGIPLDEVIWQVVLLDDRPLTEAEYNHPLTWDDARRNVI